jgi:hypothetical protein
MQMAQCSIVMEVASPKFYERTGVVEILLCQIIRIKWTEVE